MCLLQDDKLKSYDVIYYILEIKTDEGWKHRFDINQLITLCHAHQNELHGEKIKILIELIEEPKKIYEACN